MTSKFVIGCIAGIFTLASVPTSAKADPSDGFKSPSGNIQCAVQQGFVADGKMYPTTLRCDMRENVSAPRPRWCNEDWGRTFEIAVGDTMGRLICVGDSINHPRHPVLPYGMKWQHHGFTCVSQPTGVTCTNDRQHGFSISRAMQRVF